MAESTNPSSEAPNPLQAIIDTTSKLRQGFAPLPRVRDKQEHAPEITKEFDHIATKFLEIFSETRMDWHFVDIARQFFDGHPQVRSKAYIRVFAPWRPNDDAWHNALKRFEEKYIITGIVALTEVGLEIQDPSKREWISSIPEHHSIFERWKSLQEEALVLLEGSEWSVLTACRYGPSPESQRDPIIIYLGVENPYLFEEIGWKLIKMCRKFNLEDVSVRVLETSIWTSLGSDSDPVEVDLEAVNTLNTIRMGSSLNAGNRKESGTFGGLVKLKSSDGTSEAFGVTNFHVVWDCEKKKVKNKETGEETEVEPTGIDAEFQNYGIDPERIYPEFKDGIPLYSPSDTGTQRVLHSWNRSIEQWESELVDRIRMVEEERGGIWRDRDETFKREREKNIQTFRDKIQKLENSERRIGSVYAASGNRFQESGLSYILDWTLIKLNPDKDFNNIIPSAAQVGGSWYNPKSKWLSEISTSKVIGGQLLQVLKKGRTTGLTVGVIDSLETLVNLNHKPVIAWKIYASNMTKFAQPGDSGSFVLNHEGQLQGVLFGGWDNGFGLMIPIDVLIKDIETRTKREVYL